MTINHICYFSTSHECVATEEVLDRIKKYIHYEFVKGGGKNSIFAQGTMWHRTFLLTRHSFTPGPVNLGFVVDKMKVEHNT
jgi:hypothetical protein